MIQPFQLSLCLAALLAASPVLAINKCTGADGKVSYQEAKCAVNSSAGSIVLAPMSAGSMSLDDRLKTAAKRCGVDKLPESPAIGWDENRFLSCSVVGLSETPKINTTETVAGVSKQYVFRYYKTYVYVRGGLVVAVQH